MKRIMTLLTALAFLLGLTSPSSKAQDISKEIRENWGSLGKALEKFQLELEVLKRIESKLMDQYQRLLMESDLVEKELLSRTGSPESLSALLQNCMVELQRIRWEEATEKAVSEELSTKEEVAVPTESDLASLELKVRIDTLRVKLAHQQESYAQYKQLFEKGSAPRSEMQAIEGKLEQLKAEMAGAENELKMQETIAEAEKKMPLVETTRNLARFVARRKLLEEETVELRKQLQMVVDVRQLELKASLLRKQVELFQEQLVPIQSRKLQVEAMIEVYEEELKKL